MTSLYIIRGVPGAGKTTLGNRLKAGQLVRYVYSADDWMVDEKGNYAFHPRNLPKCHQLCQDATEAALMHGESVAVCNTFIRVWEMQPYVQMAERLDCTLSVIRCEGNFENVHGVPRSKVEQMHGRFEEWRA